MGLKSMDFGPGEGLGLLNGDAGRATEPFMELAAFKSHPSKNEGWGTRRAPHLKM